MNDKIQLDTSYDIFTEEALDQLEVAGIASVLGNQVHYYDVERNIYRYCASTNNIHIAVCRVLASVDEEIACIALNAEPYEPLTLDVSHYRRREITRKNSDTQFDEIKESIADELSRKGYHS